MGDGYLFYAKTVWLPRIELRPLPCTRMEDNNLGCKTVFYGRNIDHGYKYYLHSAELENTPTIKNLRVIFDPELSFSQYCKKK